MSNLGTMATLNPDALHHQTKTKQQPRLSSPAFATAQLFAAPSWHPARRKRCSRRLLRLGERQPPDRWSGARLGRRAALPRRRRPRRAALPALRQRADRAVCRVGVTQLTPCVSSAVDPWRFCKRSATAGKDEQQGSSRARRDRCICPAERKTTRRRDPPVQLAEVEQQRCPRRLSARRTRIPAPSASARRLTGSARSSSRRPGRRVAPFAPRDARNSGRRRCW